MKVPSEKRSSLAGSAGGSSSNPFEHRVARAISACTRCRSRKSKCDGKLPACSACVKAKVECIGFDAISKQNVSRSYIHDLEQEVLALRAQCGLPLDGPNTLPLLHLPVDHRESGSTTPSYHPTSAYGSGTGSGMVMDDKDDVKPPGIGMGHSQAETEGARALSALGAAGMWDGSLRGYVERNGNGVENNGNGNGNGDIDPSLTGGGGRMGVGSIPGGMGFSGGYLGPGGSGSGSGSSRQEMGSRADVGLARMVVDAVMRSGPAGGPLTPPPRRDSNLMMMLPALSGLGTYNNPPGAGGPGPGDVGTGGLYPTSHQRGPRQEDDRGTDVRSSFSHDSRRGDEMNGANNNHMGGGPRRKTIDIPALPPPAAVDRLVQVYVDFVQIMLPILHMPTFGDMLIRVRDRTEDVSEADIFFVLMVLAMSTMALSRSLDPTAELRMSSEAFYLEAVKHLEATFEETDSLVGLQAILLFCYYSLLNPTRGSIWFLVGLASRMAVDHGLHHETSQSDNLTPLELDMNRRLFYSVFNLDRLLCHALGRPPSIPDTFVSVPAFSSLPDTAITNHGLHPSEPDPYKVVALNYIPLRELQSTIYSRLYSVRSFDPPSHEWFMTMFERLKSWLQNSPDPRGTQTTEGYAVSFHNTVLLLFRPSPACPRPSQEALATCLSSSSYIIRIFKSLQRKNKISWLWLSVGYRGFRRATIDIHTTLAMQSHYVFMAGITYLYGLWNVNMLGDSTVAPSLMEAHLDVQACLSTLEALAVSVPSARQSRWTFEMLSTAILTRLSGEQAFSETSGSSVRDGGPGDAGAVGAGVNGVGSSNLGGDTSSSRLLPPDGPGLGIGTAGARAESAMRHSFQSQGFPSPLPKMDLPSEISLLDNLFLNPMIPHPKASDSTTVGNGFLHTPRVSVSPPPMSGGSRGPGDMPYSYPGLGDLGNSGQGQAGDNGNMMNGNDGQPPRIILAGSPANHMIMGGGSNNGGMHHPGLSQAETDLAASGFDFLSFLAADDGGQGANAVWEQTEPFRQEMPMLG